MSCPRHLVASALSLLLLPFVCFAQTPARREPLGRTTSSVEPPGQPNRGTTSAPRRGGPAGSSATLAVGQRRSGRGVMTAVQLPAPLTSGSVSVETALGKVQDLPAPTDQPLKLSEVGQLAWAAQGRPASATTAAAPADERALMKVYFALPDGLYLYVPANHSLQETRDADVRASLSAGLLNQQNAPVGGCQIVVSGSSRDFNVKYGNRARNVMLLLAGQMVQSIQLQAVALNLTFVGINNVDINTARRLCGLTRDIEPLYVVLVGYPVAAPQTSPMASSTKVVIIAPQNGFQDYEFFETKRGLEMNSVQVLVASVRAGPIRSMGGASAMADLSIGQVRAADFNAIVFVGGIGTADLVNDRVLWEMIRQAAAQRKIMAASGIAPLILGAAGVLGGARVTGPIEIRDRLTAAGALYTGTTVQRDGPLITSMGPGPQIVPVFVQAILETLAGT